MLIIPRRTLGGVLAALLCFVASTAAPAPRDWAAEWPRTDFSRSAVGGWSEIRSGGPGRDGIPALDSAKFHRAADVRALEADEPVITLELGGPPRAYPIRYLIWHEIVNDRVGGVPVAVTYCPLCNSALVFDRRARGRTLSFGVTGKLRASDMVMYDRETESWWQQALGRGIVGQMTGVELDTLPSWMESWQTFRDRNPQGLVMAEPAHERAYGSNPYRGYDRANWPFLYDGAPPPHGIPPLERVVRVGDRAWPLSRLAGAGTIREAGVVIDWRAGQASALDAGSVGAGRDIGMIRVRDGQGRDMPHDLLFAFAFHAFWPEGSWMLGR